MTAFLIEHATGAVASALIGLGLAYLYHKEN